MLSHPVPDAPIALTTDASDYAVGAVLEQLVKGTWRPLAFFSKPAHQALDQPVVLATAPRRGRPPSIRPTRAAQVPSPDVAPQTTAATLPRTRAGREIKAPVKLMLPVFVNSGGACVGDT
ncbi:hypothetical protein AAFF_G00379780 [Aldrovandia affinis]|uniref:Reverse transcriptase/retrotransposon-derived protein RNase H-like domain-containing protein n=1 Tax=Aldrovandia affinis TaxID=143900 RepID=A0AAD7VYS8_9TELE|nr:hypothetical protein AAFF_G00379780 [Aldrovandia affinis]